MKKHGLLNPQFAAAVARLGHGDTIVVADPGLPIPRDVPIVDLAVVFGLPAFTPVVEALLGEIAVEGCTVASEARDSKIWEELENISTLAGCELTEVTHEELKSQIARAAFVVRTGEATSFANLIFRCGVPF